MKFTVPRDLFLAQMDKMRGVVARSADHPMLKNVLVRVDEEEVILQATNLDLSQEAHMPMVKVESTGRCLVPADKLYQILTAAGSQDVVMELIQSTVFLTAGRTKWRLLSASADDFPTLPEPPEDGNEFKMDREVLHYALGRVSFAVCDDDTRENMMMVALEDGLMMAASGSMASAMKCPQLDENLKIPAAALAQLVGLLRSSGLKEVLVVQNTVHLFFKVGSDIFSMRQLEADFANVKETLFKRTEGFSQKLIVDRNALREAIGKTRILADPTNNALRLLASHKQLELVALDPMGQEAKDELECECSAEGVNISINAEHLADVTKSLKGEKVTVKFSERNTLTPLRIEEEDFTVVMLQLRIQAAEQAGSVEL